MENNNKHLVRVGHEFAAAMSDETPIITIAKMVTELASALDVQTARSEALAKKLNEMAAENAGLKSFGDKLSEMLNDLNGEGTGIQGRAEVAIQQIALEAAMEEFDAIETTDTDAFLAEVRAQGVEMFATELGNVYQQLRSGSSHAHAIKSAVFRAGEFAAQLRGNSNGGAA